MHLDQFRPVVEVALSEPIETDLGVLRRLLLRAPTADDFAQGQPLVQLIDPSPSHVPVSELNPEERRMVATLRNAGVPVDRWGDSVAVARALGLFERARATPFVIERNLHAYAAMLARLAGIEVENVRALAIDDAPRCFEAVEALVVQHFGAQRPGMEP